MKYFILVMFLYGTANAVDMVPYSLSKSVGDTIYVNILGDTMTGPLTLSGSTLTVTGNAFSVGVSTFNVLSGRVHIGPFLNGYSAYIPAAKLETQNAAAEYALPSGSGNTPETGLMLRLSGGLNRTMDFGTYGANFWVQARDYDNFANTANININPIGGNVGIGTTSPADKLDISSGTIRMAGSGTPTGGGALCLNASGQMAKCTSAVDASGNCTCP